MLVQKNFNSGIAEHGSVADKDYSLCRSYVQFVELVFSTFEHISELLLFLTISVSTFVSRCSHF